MADRSSILMLVLYYVPEKGCRGYWREVRLVLILSCLVLSRLPHFLTPLFLLKKKLQREKENLTSKRSAGDATLTSPLSRFPLQSRLCLQHHGPLLQRFIPHKSPSLLPSFQHRHLCHSRRCRPRRRFALSSTSTTSSGTGRAKLDSETNAAEMGGQGIKKKDLVEADGANIVEADGDNGYGRGGWKGKGWGDEGNRRNWTEELGAHELEGVLMPREKEGEEGGNDFNLHENHSRLKSGHLIMQPIISMVSIPLDFGGFWSTSEN